MPDRLWRASIAALTCGDSQTFSALEAPARSLQGLFIKSAPKKRPQRGGGERWGHRVWLCSTTARGRGGELSLIKPAHAGSATVVHIEHPWKFSTASDLF